MLRLKLGASRGGSYENSLDDIRREDFFPIAFKKLKGSWVKCDWSITQIIFNDQSVWFMLKIIQKWGIWIFSYFRSYQVRAPAFSRTRKIVAKSFCTCACAKKNNAKKKKKNFNLFLNLFMKMRSLDTN
jgi:hypothetical protein